MNSFADFPEILRRDEPLAPYTWLKLGGPAQYFLTPRSRDELVRLVKHCSQNSIPMRILGGGSNLLVRDEGVSGAVISLNSPAFSEVTVLGDRLSTGCGALLSHALSVSVKAGLAGLENLAGIPGTVGGALHGNAGGRNGDLGQYVHSVTVLTADGRLLERKEDELTFGYRSSSLTDLLLLEAQLELQRDNPEEISRRLRKIWIMKKASQPLSSQSAGCIFKNPRGLSAGAIIDQAGLKGTRVGKAEISDRHANFIVTEEGAQSNDVLRLIDLVRSKVSEQFGVNLEPEIRIW